MPRIGFVPPAPDCGAYRLRPLRLQDHHLLVASGLLPHPYKRAAATVRSWLETRDAVCWALEQEQSFAGALCCFAESPQAVTVRLHFWLQPAAVRDLPVYLPCILHNLFYERNYHRIELLLPDRLILDKAELRQMGFQLEGLLREFSLDQEGYQDASLWALLRQDYTAWQWAFVPFDQGVVALAGHAEAVYYIGFLHYGQKLPASWLSDAAMQQGLADGSGQLNAVSLKQMSCIARAPAAAFTRQKGALKEAQRQIATYLHGDLRELTFPVKMLGGSAFQKLVWQQLQAIPYAQTRSYMEVALALVQQTSPGLTEKQRRLKARHLTRSVGAACGANPLALYYPCHRVVGQNRKLIGFSGGLDIKAALLDLELVSAAASAE
ncbi:methylated-DNA--[protein]-cysteine S-methyltransferase [Oscillospiraceae bacterium HV4-5-C5C]|nr:methylated-DNA--[protein]-cysteine S-methyltransferase [Oscillospiraceae bacterium HV4-5-C5C]